jgi:hypothetical protein
MPCPRATQAADVVGAGALKRGQAFGDVVGRELGMDVEAHDDAAARLGQRGVQPAGDDAARVVDRLQARVLRGTLGQPLARAIVAAAVRHQHFQLPARRQLLRQRAVAEGIDSGALVAAGAITLTSATIQLVRRCCT